MKALDITCPTCGQSRGWECRMLGTLNRHITPPHRERVEVARTAVATIDGVVHVEPEATS